MFQSHLPPGGSMEVARRSGQRCSGQRIATMHAFGHAAFARALFAVCALAMSPVSAQQAVPAQQVPPLDQPGHRVAVIDVGYVFNNLPAIQVQISKVKAELQKHEAEVKQKRDALNQAAIRLKSMTPGTAEYNRQEELVASLDSKLRLDMRRRHNEMSEAEAKIYYDNYLSLSAAVKAVAVHNNINVVLRINGEDVDSQKRDSVMRHVMKHVVFHDPGINITDTVMRYLEQQTKTSQAATGFGATGGTQR
ncbi:MAG: OmpH family outer membrane protein [Phycisphaera sp. RhM]|nr:OmpH family outer membrane protein [Phycisphaera sp. RhM]